MARKHRSIPAGTPDECSPAQNFVLQELEGIGTAITDINNLPIRGQRLSAFQPQPALAVLTITLGRGRFLLLDFGPAMQNLAGQAQDFALWRAHRQRIVAEPAFTGTIADLSGVADRLVFR